MRRKFFDGLIDSRVKKRISFKNGSPLKQIHAVQRNR